MREAPRLNGAARRLLLSVGLRPLGTKRKGGSLKRIPQPYVVASTESE